MSEFSAKEKEREEELIELAISSIRSFMRGGRLEIERKYLPEIVSLKLLDLGNDGLPTLNSSAERKFSERGIIAFKFQSRLIFSESILSKIIKSESGIKKVILVDRTGLTISNVAKFIQSPADVENTGATACAIFSALEYQGKSLELGDLKIVTSEFSGGKIFTSACGNKMMLTIISDPDINIGLIRLILKRSGEELKSIANEEDDKYPYPYIFKPPEPPSNLGVATQLQVKKSVKEEEPEAELYCKYCGSKLKKEQKYCKLCGKKVK